MQKNLTITLDEEIYEGLYKVIGEQDLNRFIESLLKQYVVELDLEEGYRQMSLDAEYEAEAIDWVEGILGDIADQEE
jgi:predicted CopG family antitoxin